MRFFKLKYFIIGFLLWLVFSSPAYMFRYRLTVEVNTPNGVKSGSSVIEIDMINRRAAWWNRLLPFSIGEEVNIKGEAIFIDLGAGRNLIALLAHGERAERPSSYSQAEKTLIQSGTIIETYDNFTSEYRAAVSQNKGKKLPVPKEEEPTLITFGDLTDPLSARVVYGGELNRFSEEFGAGYGLKSINIEIVPAGIWPFNQIGLSFPQVLTGVKVTNEIEGKLNWVGKYNLESAAWRAMQKGQTSGSSGMPDIIFKRKM
jgi:hypothetical protein